MGAGDLLLLSGERVFAVGVLAASGVDIGRSSRLIRQPLVLAQSGSQIDVAAGYGFGTIASKNAASMPAATLPLSARGRARSVPGEVPVAQRKQDRPTLLDPLRGEVFRPFPGG